MKFEYIYIYIYIYIYANLSGLMIHVLNCEIAVSEFELLSHYNVHFHINALKKGMKPRIPTTMI